MPGLVKAITQRVKNVESAKVFTGGQRAGFHQLLTFQWALSPLIYVRGRAVLTAFR